MKNHLKIFNLFIIILLFTFACNNERRSEEAQGRELEVAGDEPDEQKINEELIQDYNPGDTVVNIRKEELPVYLRDHLQVLLSAYLDIEEALVNNKPEMAKENAQQLIEILQRHEQENMELSPQVKEFYTSGAQKIRRSAKNILANNEMWEIRSAFSAMAPAAYKLAKVADISGKKLYYQYCDKSFNNRGAYWLSRSKEIKNPYAGEASEEECGKTVATL